MKLTKDTKISYILRNNIAAIDTIASINKHFKKLKNPILRRVLAPRVTIKEAAKIGNISVNEFLKRLEDIGFEVVYEQNETKRTESESNKQVPKSKNIVVLDVRPTINKGKDPFAEIMTAIKKMTDDETLKIINVFEPAPLIKILEEKGYKCWTEKVTDDEYHTFFKKETATSHQEIISDMPISEGSFEEKMVSFGANIKEIDVRLLEMPEPMVTILKELDGLPENHVLLVHHKKIPQFLLPELKTRNYVWMKKEIGPRETDLLIFKEDS